MDRLKIADEEEPDEDSALQQTVALGLGGFGEQFQQPPSTSNHDPLLADLDCLSPQQHSPVVDNDDVTSVASDETERPVTSYLRNIGNFGGLLGDNTTGTKPIPGPAKTETWIDESFRGDSESGTSAAEAGKETQPRTVLTARLKDGQTMAIQRSSPTIGPMYSPGIFDFDIESHDHRLLGGLPIGDKGEQGEYVDTEPPPGTVYTCDNCGSDTTSPSQVFAHPAADPDDDLAQVVRPDLTARPTSRGKAGIYGGDDSAMQFGPPRRIQSFEELPKVICEPCSVLRQNGNELPYTEAKTRWDNETSQKIDGLLDRPFEELVKSGGSYCSVHDCDELGVETAVTDGKRGMQDLTRSRRFCPSHHYELVTTRPARGASLQLKLSNEYHADCIIHDTATKIADWFRSGAYKSEDIPRLEEHPGWQYLVDSTCNTGANGHICWNDKAPDMDSCLVCTAFEQTLDRQSQERSLMDKKDRSLSDDWWLCNMRMVSRGRKSNCSKDSTTWMSKKHLYPNLVSKTEKSKVSSGVCERHQQKRSLEQSCRTCGRAPGHDDSGYVFHPAEGLTGGHCDSCFTAKGFTSTESIGEHTHPSQREQLVQAIRQARAKEGGSGSKSHQEGTIMLDDYRSRGPAHEAESRRIKLRSYRRVLGSTLRTLRGDSTESTPSKASVLLEDAMDQTLLTFAETDKQVKRLDSWIPFGQLGETDLEIETARREASQRLEAIIERYTTYWMLANPPWAVKHRSSEATGDPEDSERD